MRVLTIGLLFAVFSTAAEDIPSTLRRVALNYETATDYFLRVQTTVKATVGDSSTARFDFTLAASRPMQAMMSELSRTSDTFELTIVANESGVFGYMPQRKRYSSKDRGKSDEQEELTHIHERFFRRFRLLDRLKADVKTSAVENVRVGGKNIRCLRVRLNPVDEDWTETLWIDSDRSLVVRSVMRRKRPIPEPGEVVTTTLWLECRVNEPVDGRLFMFTPPPSAQRTNNLQYR